MKTDSQCTPNCRPLLVLDKCAIQSMPRKRIPALRQPFDVLVTDTLVHEVGTAAISKEPGTPAYEKALRESEHLWGVLVHDLGGEYLANDVAFEWEAARRQSARHAPRDPIPELPSVEDLVDKYRSYLCREEAEAGRCMNVEPHSCMEEVQRLYETHPRLFYEDLARYIGDPSVREAMLEEAHSETLAHLERTGRAVDGLRKPEQDWYVYGYAVAKEAFHRFKSAKYGCKPAQPEKPANPMYDTVLLATVAIADGLLSNDKDLRLLTWACWPRQRERIYMYSNGKVVHFSPAWLAQH